LADRLRHELKRQGIAVWSGTSVAAGSEWRGRIAEAIRSAEAILVLVGPKGEAGEAQRSTWQEALEAVWQGPGKRSAPIRVQDAKVPTFVFSADIPFQAVRVDHPHHLEGAARAVARILAPTAKVRDDDTGSTGPKSGGALSVSAGEIDSGID